MARRERRDTSAASGVLGSTRRPRMRSILLPESEKLCEVWEDSVRVVVGIIAGIGEEVLGNERVATTRRKTRKKEDTCA